MNSPSITHLDLRWAGALWEVRGRLGQQALDQPLLDIWRATPPPTRTGQDSPNRLGELLEGAIGPSARRLVHAVPVRTELLKP
jgi:hypothetical protein